MLTYFVIAMSLYILGMGLTWSKKDAANVGVKVFLLANAFVGGYIIFNHNLLG